MESNDPYNKPSFSLKNRLARLLWGMVYTLFFKFSPRPMHLYRITILRLFGAKLGKHCHVYPKAKIWAPWNLEMDDYSCLADDVICYSQANIRVGEKAIVSQGTHLCAGTHDYEDPDFQIFAKPITIEQKAWICADSFVGPGVTVGQGAVIGARSVVTKSMPAWMVCAGNPCTPIKPRVIKIATE